MRRKRVNKLIDTNAIKEEYVDQVTAAKMLDVSQARISQLCTQGRFDGATKIGWSWIIPKESVKNFKPLPRGPKAQSSISEEDQKFLANKINEADNLKEDDKHDEQ